MKTNYPYIPAVVLLTALSNASALPTHCLPEEYVIFSCSTGKKIASVCASKIPGNENSNIQYRFGKIEKPELLFPSKAQPAKNNFTYTREMYAGGGGYSINFKISSYQYILNSRVVHGQEDGDITIKKDGNEIATLKCKDAPGLDKHPADVGIPEIE